MMIQPIKVFLLAVLILFNYGHSFAVEKSSPINEKKILNNARKALALQPNWDAKIIDVKKSKIANLYEATLVVTVNQNVQSRKLFVTSDSRYYVVGDFFDTNVNHDLKRSQEINLAGAPYKGRANAPVTIVEYSDPQCPSCKNAHNAIKKDKLIEGYRGKVRFVFKNFPISKRHQWAPSAAVASLCAHKQNPKSFWKFIDNVFEEQSSISNQNVRTRMLNMARELGLDLLPFQKCYDNRIPQQQIQKDMEEANKIGIYSTPSFLVNGKIIRGYPGTEQFKKIINELLAK